jgi:hypothetical protein
VDEPNIQAATDCKLSTRFTMSNIVRQSVSTLLDAWIKAEQGGVKFPVPFDIAWQIAEYSTKANAKRDGLKALKKGIQFSSEMMKKPGRGRSSELINLSIDGFKHFCLMADTESGQQIRQYFIESEKELRQLKIDRGYPKQIIGDTPANPSAELVSKVSSAFDILFPSVEPEIRTGMKMEAICNVDPSFRPIFKDFKPTLLLEAPLLSPTDIGKLLEERDGIKRSGIAINKLLIERNLQVATGDKKLAYRSIGQGIEFSKVVADTAAGHGKTIQSLRWYESVTDLLN